MASTRKSSRVRVPKFKDDSATPSKRGKANILPIGAVTLPAAGAASPQTIVVPIPMAPVLPVPVNSASTPLLPESVTEEETVVEDMDLNTTGTTDMTGEDMVVEKVATAVFKDPNFVHSSIGAAGSKRTRVWKNLKQIIATERTLPWGPNDVTYSSIEAPPSFKPAKKYSDLSGLEARYTDPQTKLRFANPEEFARARTLPSDLVSGYLALRKATAPVP